MKRAVLNIKRGVSLLVHLPETVDELRMLSDLDATVDLLASLAAQHVASIELSELYELGEANSGEVYAVRFSMENGTIQATISKA